MSWSITTRDMPGFSHLSDAEQHWNKTKAWRNRSDDSRALGGRSMYHKRLVKNSEGYACILHNTTVVSYLHNGDVELDCYNSVSTQTFAWRVCPYGTKPLSHRGDMYWEIKTDEGTRYFRAGKDALHLTPTAPGTWALQNLPANNYEWAIDLKKAAAVRKLLKPFSLWYQAVTRLTGPISQNWQRQSTALNELLLQPNNFELFQDVAQNFGTPENVRVKAYVLSGARYKTLVPSDRLSRSSA